MLNINPKPPIYDPEAVQPMRDELLFMGFEELTTPEKVDEVFGSGKDETVFLVINSVCGCAAGSARPGACHAVQNEKIPDRLVTSFAGQDRDAVDYIRQKYLADVPPSSPFMALFKNGKPVFVMPRFHIEGRSPQEVAGVLIEKFDEHCTNEGPAVSDEDYGKLVHARACGSKIPLNQN